MSFADFTQFGSDPTAPVADTPPPDPSQPDFSAFADGGGTGTSTGYDNRPDPTAAAGDPGNFADAGGTGTSTEIPGTPDPTQRKKVSFDDPTAAASDASTSDTAFADTGGTAPATPADPTAQVSDTGTSDTAFADSGGTAPASDPTAAVSDSAPPADTRQAGATAGTGDIPMTPDQSLRYGNAAANVYSIDDSNRAAQTQVRTEVQQEGASLQGEEADLGNRWQAYVDAVNNGEQERDPQFEASFQGEAADLKARWDAYQSRDASYYSDRFTDPTAAVSDLNGVTQGIRAEQGQAFASDQGNLGQAWNDAIARQDANYQASPSFDQSNLNQAAGDGTTFVSDIPLPDPNDPAALRAAFERQYPNSGATAQLYGADGAPNELAGEYLNRTAAAMGQARSDWLAAHPEQVPPISDLEAKILGSPLSPYHTDDIGGMQVPTGLLNILGLSVGAEGLLTGGVKVAIGKAVQDYLVEGKDNLLGKTADLIAGVNPFDAIPDSSIFAHPGGAVVDAIEKIKQDPAAFADAVKNNVMDLATNWSAWPDAVGGVGDAITQALTQDPATEARQRGYQGLIANVDPLVGNSGRLQAAAVLANMLVGDMQQPTTGLSNIDPLRTFDRYQAAAQQAMAAGVPPQQAYGDAFNKVAQGWGEMVWNFNPRNPAFQAIETPFLEKLITEKLQIGVRGQRAYDEYLASNGLIDASLNRLDPIARLTGTLSKEAGARFTSDALARGLQTAIPRMTENPVAVEDAFRQITDMLETRAVNGIVPDAAYQRFMDEYGALIPGVPTVRGMRTVVGTIADGLTVEALRSGIAPDALAQGLANRVAGYFAPESLTGTLAEQVQKRMAETARDLMGVPSATGETARFAALKELTGLMNTGLRTQYGLPTLENPNLAAKTLTNFMGGLRSAMITPAAFSLAFRKLTDEGARNAAVGVYGLNPGDFGLVQRGAQRLAGSASPEVAALGRNIQQSGAIGQAIAQNVPIGSRIEALSPTRNPFQRLTNTLVGETTRHATASAFSAGMNRFLDGALPVHQADLIAALTRAGATPEELARAREIAGPGRSALGYNDRAAQLTPIVPATGMAQGRPASPRVMADINRTEPGLVGNAGRGPVVSTKSWDEVAAHMGQPPVGSARPDRAAQWADAVLDGSGVPSMVPRDVRASAEARGVAYDPSLTPQEFAQKIRDAKPPANAPLHGDIAAGGGGGMGYLSPQQRAVRDDLNAAGGFGTGRRMDYGTSRGAPRSGAQGQLDLAAGVERGNILRELGTGGSLDGKLAALDPTDLGAIKVNQVAVNTEIKYAEKELAQGLHAGNEANVYRDLAEMNRYADGLADMRAKIDPTYTSDRLGRETFGTPPRPLTPQERIQAAGLKPITYEGVRTPTADARFTPVEPEPAIDPTAAVGDTAHFAPVQRGTFTGTPAVGSDGSRRIADVYRQFGALRQQLNFGASQAGVQLVNRAIGELGAHSPIGEKIAQWVYPFSDFHFNSTGINLLNMAAHPLMPIVASNFLAQQQDPITGNLPVFGSIVSNLDRYYTGASLLSWANDYGKYAGGVAGSDNNPLQKGAKLAFNTVAGNSPLVAAPFDYLNKPLEVGMAKATNPVLDAKGRPVYRDQVQANSAFGGVSGLARMAVDQLPANVPFGAQQFLRDKVAPAIGNPAGSLLAPLTDLSTWAVNQLPGRNVDLKATDPLAQLPYRASDLAAQLGWTDPARTQRAVGEIASTHGNPTSADGQALLRQLQYEQDQGMASGGLPSKFSDTSVKEGPRVFPPNTPTETAAYFRNLNYEQRAGEGGKDAGVGRVSKAGNYYLQTPDQAAQQTAQAQLHLHADLGTAPTMDYARDYLQRTGDNYLPPGGRPESQAVAERSQAIYQGSIDANARRSGAGLPADQRQAFLSEIAPGFTVADLVNQKGNVADLARQYAIAKGNGASKDELARIGAALNAAKAADAKQSPFAASYLGMQDAARAANAPPSAGTAWYNGQPQPVKDAYDAFNDLRNSADYKAYTALEKAQAAAGVFGSPEEKAWYNANKTELNRLKGIVADAEQSILARYGVNPKDIANQEAIAAGRAAPYGSTAITAQPTATASTGTSGYTPRTSSARTSSGRAPFVPYTAAQRAAFGRSQGGGGGGGGGASSSATAGNTFFNEYKALVKGTPEYKAAVADPVVRATLGAKGLTAAQYDAATTALRADVQRARNGGNGVTPAAGSAASRYTATLADSVFGAQRGQATAGASRAFGYRPSQAEIDAATRGIALAPHFAPGLPGSGGQGASGFPPNVTPINAARTGLPGSAPAATGTTGAPTTTTGQKTFIGRDGKVHISRY